MSEILTTISSLVIEGNFTEIVAKTNQALEEGLGAEEILNKGLMPGMDHVGLEFKAGTAANTGMHGNAYWQNVSDFREHGSRISELNPFDRKLALN